MILNRLIFWAMIFIFLHERWLKTSITYRRKNLGAIVDSIGKLIKSCVFVQQLQILQHVVKSRERLYLSQPTNKYRTILRQKCPGICTDAPVSQPSTIELFRHCFLTVEHSAPAQRHVGAVTVCVPETFEDPSLCFP